MSQSIDTQQSSTTPSIYAVSVLEFSGPLTRRTPCGVAVLSCIVFGCARRVPSPRIFGRGSQGAATDAAAWAGRKSETAAPRACLQGVEASGRHLHPDGNGWNRSIRPMLCIGEIPVHGIALCDSWKCVLHGDGYVPGSMVQSGCCGGCAIPSGPRPSSGKPPPAKWRWSRVERKEKQPTFRRVAGCGHG